MRAYTALEPDGLSATHKLSISIAGLRIDNGQRYRCYCGYNARKISRRRHVGGGWLLGRNEWWAISVVMED